MIIEQRRDAAFGQNWTYHCYPSHGGGALGQRALPKDKLRLKICRVCGIKEKQPCAASIMVEDDLCRRCAG